MFGCSARIRGVGRQRPRGGAGIVNLTSIVHRVLGRRRPVVWGNGGAWRAPPRRRSSRALPLRGIGYFVAAVGALLLIPAAVDTGRGALMPRSGCRLAHVIDGDTVALWCPGQGFVDARLLGFDTPEVFSPRCPQEWVAGMDATWGLRTRIWTAGEVRFVLEGRDRYDRRLARLWLDGRDVAASMIADGHARPYDGGRRAGWCGAAASAGAPATAVPAFRRPPAEDALATRPAGVRTVRPPADQGGALTPHASESPA